MPSTGGLDEYLKRIQTKRVNVTLKREYEVSRLIMEKQGCGPALIVNVNGAVYPAALNVVDTREKLLAALDSSNEEDAHRKLARAYEGRESNIQYKEPPTLKSAPRGLLSLPEAVKAFEGEAGFYISSGVFIACYNGVCNASIHRILVLDDKRGAVRIVPRHLWKLYNEAVKREGELEVTVALGLHPAVLLAAASNPPLGVFELEVASRLLGGLMVYRSPVHGNPVPLGAAAIIEGRLTSDTVEEGPYVDALMTYDRVRKQPVLEVDAVYYRKGGVGHVIIGGSLDHVNLMGFPREAAIREAVARVVPRVGKVRLTPGGGGWLHAVIQIEKQHEGDGKSAIMAALAAHPSLKHVVIVDMDVDPDEPVQVEWAIATRFQAHKDLVVITHARGSTLDPSSEDGLTSKMGLDATKPLQRSGQYTGYERGRIPGFRGARNCT